MIAFKIFLFIYGCAGSLLLCMKAFSGCSEQGLLLVASLGLVTVVASRVAEHRLKGVWASVVATLRLLSCGSWA